MALVDYGDSDLSDSDCDMDVIPDSNSKSQRSNALSDFQDKVEDEYKMRMPRNAKPILQPLNLKRKTGLNGKVILSIPTVEDLDSSDDSDDDFPKRVQDRFTKNKSRSSKSLLDLLPPTRSLIVREGDKPVISQSLVPRQAVRKLPPPKPLPSKPAGPIVDFDDEILDELPSKNSFFTFEAVEEPSASALSAEEVRRKTREAILASEASAKSSTELTAPQGPSSSTSSDGTYLPPLKEKPFSELELQKRPRAQEQQGDSDGEFEHENEEEPLFTAETFIPGPERKKARMALGGVRDPSSVEDLLAAVPGGLKIREIKAADLTAGSDLELLKNVTKGRPPKVDPSQHVVDNPGKLAFRKHQITWLAYKAQENEYELQEQWAEARRNKTLSRQKYGF
nr:Mitotic checkpoint protein PRCC C terminal [Hymenolepis microstoma]